MTDISKELLVTAEEIAKYIGRKPSQVYSIHRTGKSPIRNRPGIGLSVLKRDIDRYFSANGIDTQDHV